MAIVYLNVDGVTEAVKYANYTPGFLNDNSSFYAMLDDSDTGVMDLLTNISSHKYGDIKGTNPYLTARYDGSNVIVTLVNAPSPAPTTLPFSLFGKIYNAPITNNQATIPITIHAAVNKQRLPVTFNLNGFPYTYIEIGGYGSNVDAQVYQDAGGVYRIVPVNSADLANYWTAIQMDTSWMMADLATIVGLLTQVVFQRLLPNTNVTLSADEQNAILDVQTNIFPSIVSTLDKIAPVGQADDIHYASYKAHIVQAKAAMDNYTADRNEIMKYTNLK